MFNKIICFLLDHTWHFYPENTDFHDYKVCDRCNKSIALSPYLTAGEVDYLERTLINAISTDLIARSSYLRRTLKNEDNAVS